jgi:hypothetical protein
VEVWRLLVEELGGTLLSGLKEILSGKSKAIAPACRGSGSGVESSKPKRSISRHVTCKKRS